MERTGMPRMYSFAAGRTNVDTGGEFTRTAPQAIPGGSARTWPTMLRSFWFIPPLYSKVVARAHQKVGRAQSYSIVSH